MSHRSTIPRNGAAAFALLAATIPCPVPALACQSANAVPMSVLMMLDRGAADWRVTDHETGESCVITLIERSLRSRYSGPPTPRHAPCTLPGLDRAAERVAIVSGGREIVRIHTASGRRLLTFRRPQPEEALTARGPRGHRWTIAEPDEMAPKTRMEGAWEFNWVRGAEGVRCTMRLTSDAAGLSGEVQTPHACPPVNQRWVRWERRDGRLRLFGDDGRESVFTPAHQRYELAFPDGALASLAHTRDILYCGGPPRPEGTEPPMRFTVPAPSAAPPGS